MVSNLGSQLPHVKIQFIRPQNNKTQSSDKVEIINTSKDPQFLAVQVSHLIYFYGLNTEIGDS